MLFRNVLGLGRAGRAGLRMALMYSFVLASGSALGGSQCGGEADDWSGNRRGTAEPTSALPGRAQKPEWTPPGGCAIWHRCAAQAQAAAGRVKQAWDGVAPSRAERGLGSLPRAAQVAEGPKQHWPVLATPPSLLTLLCCGQGTGVELPASVFLPEPYDEAAASRSLLSA